MVFPITVGAGLVLVMGTIAETKEELLEGLVSLKNQVKQAKKVRRPNVSKET